MKSNHHIKIFKEIISEYKIIMKWKKIEEIQKFNSILKLLKNRENLNIYFENIYNLNESYKKIIIPLYDIKINNEENFIIISSKETIIFDIKYGVIDSTFDFQNLKFEMNHRIIIDRLISQMS